MPMTNLYAKDCTLLLILLPQRCLAEPNQLGSFSDFALAVGHILHNVVAVGTGPAEEGLCLLSPMFGRPYFIFGPS